MCARLAVTRSAGVEKMVWRHVRREVILRERAEDGDERKEGRGKVKGGRRKRDIRKAGA